jgi:hypothetical protein
MVVTFDVGNGQVVGNSGQFGCRPWLVPLAKLVNCCGEGGQLPGVLHFTVAATLWFQAQTWSDYALRLRPIYGFTHTVRTFRPCSSFLRKVDLTIQLLAKIRTTY